MRKFSKTKKIKKTKRIKKTKIIKTRKFIRITGGTNEYVKDVVKANDSPTASTSITKPEPIKVNTINGSPIYKVIIKGCNHYFYGHKKKYVIIGHTNEIFKLDESAEDLPMEIVEKITDIIKTQKLKEFELDSTEFEPDSTGFEPASTQFEPDYYYVDMDIVDEIEEFLIRHNILYLTRHKCHPTELNLTEAKAKLMQLNKALQQKCSNLRLSIDYIYNHEENSLLEYYGHRVPPTATAALDMADHLLLCLYINYHCVSSIVIEIDGVKLTLASKTHKNYEGKKYNILLRSVLIIISNLLSPNIEGIISIAENPKSAYILMHHFGGELLKDDDSFFLKYSGHSRYNNNFLKLSQIFNMPLYKPNTNYIELLKLYDRYYGYKPLTINVELSEDNIKNAEKKFVEILDKIDCSEKLCLLGTMKKCLHFLQ